EARLTTVARLAEVARLDVDFMQIAELHSGADVDLVRLVTELVIDEGVPYVAAYRYKEGGLRKWVEWERTWEMQRTEDGIDARSSLSVDDPRHLTPQQAATLKRQEVGTIPVPPRYTSADFVKTSYWR